GFQRADSPDKELIEIVMVDGSRYTANKSDIASPTSLEIMAKFRSNARLVVTDELAEELIDTIMSVDRLDDVGELVKHCVAGGVAP
ncbi:MAG: hypothetical protein QXX57_04645, partial [Nitrososphaerota archaeon]